MDAYATALDFTKQFGAQMGADLLDRSQDNNLTADCLLATLKFDDVSDFDELNRAAAVEAVALVDVHLSDAYVEINGYLNVRYQLPLFGDVAATPLKRMSCDIARYLVASTHDLMSDIIEQRYKDVIKWLNSVSLGKVVLNMKALEKSTSKTKTAGVGFVTGKKLETDDY